MPITLVLADDHPLVLDGLERVFDLQSDLRVVARCGDGEATLAAVREHRPEILVLDLRMPRGDGLAVLRALKGEGLPTRVVVLTAALDENDVLEAIRLGVRGVVLKEMARQLLVQCIRKVHGGGKWLERRSVVRALDKMLRHEEAERELAARLTAREIEVMRLVAKGLRNKDIARELGVTEGNGQDPPAQHLREAGARRPPGAEPVRPGEGPRLIQQRSRLAAPRRAGAPTALSLRALCPAAVAPARRRRGG